MLLRDSIVNVCAGRNIALHWKQAFGTCYRVAVPAGGTLRSPYNRAQFFTNQNCITDSLNIPIIIIILMDTAPNDRGAFFGLTGTGWLMRCEPLFYRALKVHPGRTCHRSSL